MSIVRTKQVEVSRRSHVCLGFRPSDQPSPHSRAMGVLKLADFQKNLAIRPTRGIWSRSMGEFVFASVTFAQCGRVGGFPMGQVECASRLTVGH